MPRKKSEPESKAVIGRPRLYSAGEMRNFTSRVPAVLLEALDTQAKMEGVKASAILRDALVSELSFRLHGLPRSRPKVRTQPSSPSVGSSA